MIALILMGLAKANLAAGAAILVVLALRTTVRPRFGAGAAYLMWLAPLAAALAVLAPHPAVRTVMTPMVQDAATAVEAFVATAPTSASAWPDLAGLALAVWIAGMLAVAALLLRRQAMFLRAMGRLEAVAGSGVYRAEHPGVGPAVVGVLRPRIVAPVDFETRFGAGERELILAHEGVHLRRGDAAVNALACAAQCLCWFNPLVHLAAHLLRIDQELACDARVIDRFPDARKTYAELLLKTQLATQALPLGCHWPAGSAHPLKARIAMLTSPLPARVMRRTGLALVAGVTLGAGGLAWAAQPAGLNAPGAAQRLAAEADGLTHPEYTCDPAGEARMEGCKIVRTSRWKAMPTRDDVLRRYPPAALKAGAAAQVMIRCAITPEGLLNTCEPVDTTIKAPDGTAVDAETRAAFGQAAVELSRLYQVRIPPVPNRKPGHGTFRIVFAPSGDGDPFGPPGARSLPPLPAPGRPAAPSGASRTDVSFAPPAPPVIVQPDWVVKPVPADVADVYPADALKAGLSGAATIACGVSAEGRLVDCKLQDEAPADAGFGAAALKLSERFQMKPMSRDGHPVTGGKVRIPFRFALPRPAQPVTPS